MADYMTPEEMKQYVESQKALYEAGAINSQQLATAMNDAKKGVVGYTAGMDAAKGVMLKGALGLAEGFADGKKGAEAFNGAIDSAVAALGILMTILNPLGAAFAAMGIAALSYTKKVNEQADALYKANQDLARAGAVGAGGMTEIYENLKKLGYGTEELAQMTELLKEHGQELALFGGTAFTGAKRLAEVSDALKPMQNQFMNMGLSVDDINKGIAGYIGLQNRLGKAQSKDAAELAKESGEYLRNMSMLSKLTGESADALQKKKEEALTIEAMYASIENMPDDVQKLVTDKYAYIQSKLGQDAAVAFAKLTTGMASSEETQKINQRFGFALGQAARNFNQPINEMAVGLQGGLRGAHAFNRSSAIFSDSIGDYGRYVSFMKQDTKTLQESVGVAATAVTASAEGADEATDESSKLRIQQMRTRTALQDMINSGIVPVTKGLQGLSSVLNGVTGVGAQNQQKEVTKSETPSFGGVGANTVKFTGTKGEFYNQLYGTLLAEAKKANVSNPEAIARLGAAQSSLETGYGKSLAGGNNYFGIKATDGKGNSQKTQEYINGKLVTVDAQFRKYNSMQESAADYIKFLQTNQRYQSVLNSKTVAEAISAQAKTGYATDPMYASKLAGITEAARQFSATAPKSGLEITNPSAEQSKIAESKQSGTGESGSKSWEQYQKEKADREERLIAETQAMRRELQTGNSQREQQVTLARAQ